MLAAMHNDRVRRRRQEATGQTRTGNGFRLGAAIAGNRREIVLQLRKRAASIMGGTIVPMIECLT